jgi:hypothetical protein
MIFGLFILASIIKPLFQAPIDFIIDIALIAGGLVLFVKGGE